MAHTVPYVAAIHSKRVAVRSNTVLKEKNQGLIWFCFAFQAQSVLFRFFEYRAS